MATTRGKHSKTASKTSTKGKSSSKKKTAAEPKGRPIRREVWSFVCLLLAVLCVFGCFRVDAVLINVITKACKGFIGGGFYAMPICLFICFVTLLMHEGRPVKARVICALIVTVCVGALVHLFSAKTNVEWSVKIFADLWNGGNAGTAGGVLSGFLAMLLKLLISKAGAIIVFLVAALVLALYSMNMTPMSIIRAIHNRPRRSTNRLRSRFLILRKPL